MSKYLRKVDSRCLKNIDFFPYKAKKIQNHVAMRDIT